MNRKNGGVAVALCLLAGRAGADSSAATSCIAAWTASCSASCATPRCVADCTTQAHDVCTQNVAAPQQAFTGPVTGTFTGPCTTPSATLACAPALAAASDTCSVISGSVTNAALWGGQVTVYVICPPGAPAGQPNETPTTTVIGSAQSSCADGKFTITATNACAGQTGCYGLIAASPPASCESCGTCAGTPGDPNWSTCTDAACPAP